MSDISDLLQALVGTVALAVYPQPPDYDIAGKTWDEGRYDQRLNPVLDAATPKFDKPGLVWDAANGIWDTLGDISVSGTPIVIYAGWPSSDNLARDLAAGKTHITVFPKQEERNTTRYHETNHVVLDPAPTIIFSGSNLTRVAEKFDTGALWDATGNFDGSSNGLIIVGGSVSSPQNLAIKINGKFYAYAVAIDDTLASISVALAALIAVDIPGTVANGQVITVGSTGRVQAARVGGFGTVAREVRRQERLIQITVWTNAPALRDTISSAVDVALAEMRFMRMQDGFGARLIYKNSAVIDSLQKSNLYRRDINYMVEYATTISEQAAAVIAPSANINNTGFNY